jgi:hypothetical protein
MTLEEAKEILENEGMILESIPYQEALKLDTIIDRLTAIRRKVGNVYVYAAVPERKGHHLIPFVDIKDKTDTHGFIWMETKR